MFDDELMKKPQQNIWGLFMWAVILSSLVFMLFSDDWKILIEKRTYISVYLDQKQCQRTIDGTSRYLCGKSESYANSRAGTILWPYESEDECAIEFGACQKQDSGFWGPFNLGFAIVKLDLSYKPFPVYYSMKHKQYLLSSGYPVSIGDNSLPYFKPSQDYLVTRAGNLNDSICFDLSDGNRVCSTRNKMLENPTKDNLNMLMHSALGTKE